MRRLLPVLSLLLLVATSCSSTTSDIRVKSRKLVDMDLRSLQVYEWSASQAVLLDSTGTWGPDSDFQLDKVLHDAVDRELTSRGLRRVERDGLLRVDLKALGTRAQATAAQVRAGEAEDESVVTEGSILVEIYHVPTGKLVWRGVARSTADVMYTPTGATERINYAIHEMFKTFN